MLYALMGICLSCRRPSNCRLNNKISEHIPASVTPLHVCLEEQGRPELLGCDNEARKTQVNRENIDEIVMNKSFSTKVELTNSEIQDWEIQQTSMAHTITNIKMINPIKGFVSKRRKRFTKDGFDLDLTYIRPNLIAMGFPAEKLEGVYRNHIDDVVKFLEAKHKDHYKIYNLCSERSYDGKKFKERVATFAFDDHNPPKFEIIKPFCDNVHDWLSKDVKNVAAIHCKAGKGRTGVMLCCYLLHIKEFTIADSALDDYGAQRTTDKKGVTIPSQRRYVDYYAKIIRENLSYEPVELFLRQIILKSVPCQLINSNQSSVGIAISDQNKKKTYNSDNIKIKKGNNDKELIIEMLHPTSLIGDIKIEFFTTKQRIKSKEKLFHFWFNTFFVREECIINDKNGDVSVDRSSRALSYDGSSMELSMVTSNTKPHTGSLKSIDPKPLRILNIDKYDLDDAHKDKQNKFFPQDFKVTLWMDKACNMSTSKLTTTDVGCSDVSLPGQETPSESEGSECSTTSDEDGWESGLHLSNWTITNHSLDDGPII
ncbi:phosphatidylinositol 3,4,5-trisphosphate 3-phosphatase and dual-specificity protein phosphatase PTEN isoform X2 [Aphidius gifuensis]|uniref:phosphatidylinositol 3,4,5-trisphosphate 3-phosphatase and dual-specificity protein phosphatase PTEN isoform X2 n=1 Tax=Aphidius gifuensis TaxID=684658 RepID=UPI001CDB775F|nr:phosphatidylinositol 3,4,5-trisphosphate 3-phosphatase and dual-specificity protein phosphatase PTEN isoform X2 [Aphidius gifuensis]XP_044001405.1 phosphatidylinositol 3,4,5-trisphosphate 3-phosphatase and dual-specificity protein phosphatase PTEN isoform X2 [Aphidius gifuensis]